MLKDLQKLFYGVITSILVFLILAVWRKYDTNTFIFLQIVFISILLYFILLIFSRMGLMKLINGNEFVSVLVAFTLIFLLVGNIDRSRSVFLIKWVDQYSKEKPITIAELFTLRSFSLSEEISIKQRIDEQKQTLFIKQVDSKLQVTLLGKCFIKFAEIIAQLLNLKGFKSA
jgi:hypothetical protein